MLRNLYCSQNILCQYDDDRGVLQHGGSSQVDVQRKQLAARAAFLNGKAVAQAHGHSRCSRHRGQLLEDAWPRWGMLLLKCFLTEQEVGCEMQLTGIGPRFLSHGNCRCPKQASLFKIPLSSGAGYGSDTALIEVRDLAARRGRLNLFPSVIIGCKVEKVEKGELRECGSLFSLALRVRASGRGQDVDPLLGFHYYF